MGTKTVAKALLDGKNKIGREHEKQVPHLFNNSTQLSIET